MIKDLTNPHERPKQTRVEDISQWTDNIPYRVIQIQGVFTVEALFDGKWSVVINQRNSFANGFQTLQEAENLILKLRQPSKIYYYD